MTESHTRRVHDRSWHHSVSWISRFFDAHTHWTLSRPPLRTRAHTKPLSLDELSDTERVHF